MLCDINASHGTLQCFWGTGSCPGASPGTGNDNNCYPYCVWSQDTVDGDTSYHRGFCMHNNQSLTTSGVCVGNVGKCITTYSFTVRCVLDMDTQKASKCSALISTGSQRKSGLHKISQDSANGVCYHLNTIMLVQNMGKSCNVNIKTSSVTRGPATALCNVMQA